MQILLGVCLWPGCDSSAVGVDACREIEYARCEASVPCGVVSDVQACKMFYRDHCLHGLRGATSPSTAELSACTQTIEIAGDCESDGHASVADCPGLSGSSSLFTQVCDIVQSPQETAACEFLNDPPPAPQED